MDTLRLGDSGLQVSRVILGCMSYGDPDRGNHSWSLPLDESRQFFRRAIEGGITTFDTANVYSDGSSEEITGTLLQEEDAGVIREGGPADFLLVHGDPLSDPAALWRVWLVA